MAEPIESLVKKEAEPQRDPIVSTSTSAIILVCTLLLIGVSAWALYDEAYGQRPWKGIQRQFVARYTRYLDSIKPKSAEGETAVKESPEYQALDAEAKAADEKVQPDIKQIDVEVRKVQDR